MQPLSRKTLSLLFAGCLAACTVDKPAEFPSNPPAPVSEIPSDLSEPAPQLAVPTVEAGPSFDPSGLAVGPGAGFVVLDNPRVVPASQASWLSDDEIVLGVVAGGAARAYPVTQMAYHHIANDQINGEPYLVTY